MADSAIAARRKKDRERKTPGKWARTEAARASAGFFRARPRGALCGAASVACCSFHCPSTSNTVVAAGRTEPAAADSCRVAPLPHRSRVAAEPPSCTNALCTNALSLVAQGFVRRQPSAPARSPARRGAYTRHDYDTFASAGTSWCQRAISVHNATSLLRMPTEWRVERWLPFCIDML